MLQTQDAAKPGYYVQPGSRPKARKPADVKYEELMAKILDEDRALLANGADDVPDIKDELHNIRGIRKKQKDPSKVQCIRCRSAQYKAKFDLDQFQMESPEKIMESIPPASPIVYVVNAVDFPMSINSDVFKYVPASMMTFVVTKNDLLFPKNDLSIKYGERFFRDYLERVHKVPRENVYCVSGANEWNTMKLMEKLKDGLCFIGAVNSGKSTLILSLVHLSHKLKLEQPNSRREREFEKLTNQAIVQGRKPPGRMSLMRQGMKNASDFKQQHGPGVSYMPGFTRGMLPFQLSRNLTVWDVPGFSAKQNAHLHEILDAQNIKLLLKGRKLHKNGMFNSHYETVKPGQAATVGGLFFLETPADSLSMFQIRNCLNFDLHIFKNIDKAKETFATRTDPAIVSKFIVEAKRAKLTKYIIPSFYGAIDLVFRTLGHITITPTGAKDPDAPPLAVYLPQGVEAIIRQPITKYVTTTLAGRDAKGNPLRKEKWVQKSVKEVKRYTGKTPFYSELVPVEDDARDTKDTLMEYLHMVKGSNVEPRVNEENKYAHWVQ